MFYGTPSYVILCLHTSPPFCQHGGKNAQQQLVKTDKNCLFVRLLVAQNDKAKKKHYDSGQNNCRRKGAVDRNVIVMMTDGIKH